MSVRRCFPQKGVLTNCGYDSVAIPGSRTLTIGGDMIVRTSIKGRDLKFEHGVGWEQYLKNDGGDRGFDVKDIMGKLSRSAPATRLVNQIRGFRNSVRPNSDGRLADLLGELTDLVGDFACFSKTRALTADTIRSSEQEACRQSHCATFLGLWTCSSNRPQYERDPYHYRGHLLTPCWL